MVTATASKQRPNHFNSNSSKSNPWLGGIKAAGPPAKRRANAASAQLIVTRPNAMVNPRYAAANPWANVATEPERRSKTVAARSIKSIIGMEYKRNELIRSHLSRYLQARPAAKNSQNAISQARIVTRSIVLPIYQQ